MSRKEVAPEIAIRQINEFIILLFAIRHLLSFLSSLIILKLAFFFPSALYVKVSFSVRSLFLLIEEETLYMWNPAWEPFAEIKWYKGSRDTPIIKRNQSGTIYYDEFCDGGSPCTSSNKGKIHSRFWRKY